MSDESLSVRSNKAECYRLLAACYCLPGPEFVEEGLVNSLSSVLEIACPAAVPFAKDMAESLAASNVKKDLLVDYSALFIGPFALRAAPYGSVYLDPEGLLMGNSTIDAVKTYRKSGVEMDKDQKDMPDHISVELEFMYYLLAKEMEAEAAADKENTDRYRQAREDFMRRHLGAWVLKFTDKMKEGAKTGFYRGLAECTSAFLKQEMKGLAVHTAEQPA
jgi:DMSO reductase family type II enzyme chaperone